MKFTLVTVLAGLVALALATPTYHQTEDDVKTVKETSHEVHENKDFLKSYTDVLTLFKYIHQNTFHKDHLDIVKEYSIEGNVHGYSNDKAVTEFLQYYHNGMLPKDVIFSVFYEPHLHQAIALFKILYHAKDFETFYKTAVWARYHCNQGLFLYSFSVALIHREDTHDMVLPPIYEIYPYYFFNADVIQQIQKFKEMHTDSGVQEKHFTVYANYSGDSLNLHTEMSMAYFFEDVGVNAYYYYYNLHRPFWMNSEEYGINVQNRGEEFYYFYQQLVARYYLERLSNHYGEINIYDYDDEFETGYCSLLRYQNGMSFPQRHSWTRFFTNFYNYKQSYTNKGNLPLSYYKIEDYERRIRDAIDAGFVVTEDGQKINLFEATGFNTLGNIVESNPESINAKFYGHVLVYARHLLGYAFQPLNDFKMAPSVLEHFETSLRDPAFWQLYKRVVLYLQMYKQKLPFYKYEDLVFKGVQVQDMEVDNLVTYFEYYNIDLTNVAYMNQREFEHNNYEFFVRQHRLNHKAFSYKIHVKSEKSTDAVVRVFIGPKYDEFGRFININENRLNFVEFDRFKYTLKSGENMIDRNSRQIYFAKDRTSYKQLYEYVMTGNEETFHNEVHYTFPNRFLLPKGKVGGQTYQFYVMVTPYKAITHTTAKQVDTHAQKTEVHHDDFPMVGLGVQYLDAYPLGYPFDRPIDQEYFYVPNSYFKDIVIYHEERIESDEHHHSYYDQAKHSVYDEPKHTAYDDVRHNFYEGNRDQHHYYTSRDYPRF